jgi:hypothetical protein
MESDRIGYVLRIVLGCGAAVFLITAPFLLLLPSLFTEWLGLTPTETSDWATRMIGAVLVALAGQMWLVRRNHGAALRGAAAVMIVGGGLMTILTVFMPAAGSWTLLRWAYLGFGLSFVLIYIVLLVWDRRQASAAFLRD